MNTEITNAVVAAGDMCADLYLHKRKEILLKRITTV